MVTNGQLNTNTAYDSYFWVKWSQVAQNVATNQTTISWSCGVYCGHSFYKNAIKMSAFTINGETVYSGGTYSNFAKGDHTIASGTLDISHNTDGSKTFTISAFTAWLYSDHDYSSDGGNYSLTTIPRQAMITEVEDFTDLDNPRMSFENPGGFRMDVWLEPNPAGDHLCVREDIPNTGSYTWTLTDAERDALRNKCTGTSCTIRLGIYSYVGGTTYADYRDVKFTVEESDATKPTVGTWITLNNGTLPSAFDGLYIQGKSKVDVLLTAQPKYNATIKRYSATIDGKNYVARSFTSDVFQSAGDVSVVGYAIDSRGFTGFAIRQINVIAYSKPLLIPLGSENAILCYRSDGNGNRTGSSTSLWIKAKMSYYEIEGKNACALQWRWKLVSEEWNDNHLWSDLLPGGSASHEYNALVQGVFDPKEAYAVQIRAIDTIGEYDIKTFEIPTQDVALHLGKGGKNVAVGTYCDYSEDYTFYSGWKAIFGGGVCIGDSNTTLKDYILSVINEGG